MADESESDEDALKPISSQNRHKEVYQDGALKLFVYKNDNGVRALSRRGYLADNPREIERATDALLDDLEEGDEYTVYTLR